LHLLCVTTKSQPVVKNFMKKIIPFVLFLFCNGIAFAGDVSVPPKRIVSLAPSMTEIMFAMGLGDNIVADTTFCDYPAEAKKKPKIGGMSNPSLEAIVSMKPDIVVLTMDGNPREVDDRLRGLKIRTFVWKARTIAELPQGIRDLGAALNFRVRADALANNIEKGVRQISEQRAARNNPLEEKKKAIFIIWPEPLIVAGPGTAIDDAMTLLGMENGASATKTTYPRYSIEEVIRRAPDVLFIGKASGMDMSAVSKGILKKLSSVPAVKTGAVCYVGDGLYRLGPRIVPGIKELAACVH
jgi:iron complex transport system substrate-binding protein